MTIDVLTRHYLPLSDDQPLIIYYQSRVWHANIPLLHRPVCLSFSMGIRSRLDAYGLLQYSYYDYEYYYCSVLLSYCLLYNTECSTYVQAHDRRALELHLNLAALAPAPMFFEHAICSAVADAENLLL